MFVPGVAAGGGVGDSERNRGWIWPSLTDGLGGRDVSGSILGGGARSSSSSSSGTTGNGPSNARAGDAGLEPGIGARAVPLDGADCMIVSLV